MKSYRQIVQESLPDEFVRKQVNKELGKRGQCQSCIEMIRGTCPDKEEQEFVNLSKKGHFCWKPDPQDFKQRCDAYERKVQSGIDKALLNKFVARQMKKFDREHVGLFHSSFCGRGTASRS